MRRSLNVNTRFRPGPACWPVKTWALRETTERYDMQAHWRRWLALSACGLAVLAACFVIAAPQAGGGSPGTPVQLTVNLVSGPMAIPAGQGIRFSWVTSDARQGESQRGYELRVAASPAGLIPATMEHGALWDTGTVTSTAPGATYAGPALRDG